VTARRKRGPVEASVARMLRAAGELPAHKQPFAELAIALGAQLDAKPSPYAAAQLDRALAQLDLAKVDVLVDADFGPQDAASLLLEFATGAMRCEGFMEVLDLLDAALDRLAEGPWKREWPALAQEHQLRLVQSSIVGPGVGKRSPWDE
jgi:hypothetical protein